MAASGSSDGGNGSWSWFNSFRCKRRTDRESEEVVHGPSDVSDSGDSKEVAKLQNEACEAIEKNDVEMLKGILSTLSRTDPSFGVLNLTNKDHAGRTALHLVADRKEICKKSKEILKLLLKYEPKLLDKADKFGNTALKLAAEKGHYEVVEMLLSHGADVTKRDIGGDTPLHSAIGKKNFKVVELLLKNGSDTGIANKRTETPLHTAVTAESLEMVELLLCHHASPNIQNKDDHTPLDLARMNNLDKISQVLKDPASAERRSTTRSSFGFASQVRSDCGREAGGSKEPEPNSLKAVSEALKIPAVIGRQGDIYLTFLERGASAAIGREAMYKYGAEEIMEGDDSEDGRCMKSVNRQSENDRAPNVYKINADNSMANLAIGDNAKLLVSSTPSSPVNDETPNDGVLEPRGLPATASETKNITEKTCGGTETGSKGTPPLTRVQLKGGLAVENNPNSQK